MMEGRKEGRKEGKKERTNERTKDGKEGKGRKGKIREGNGREEMEERREGGTAGTETKKGAYGRT